MMERLTFEGNFCDIAMCQETPGGSFCEDGMCSQRKVWERLKHYEDMEEQGRLVVLPCKVGDTIYKLCPVSTFLKKGDLWSGRIIERDCDMCAWGCCDCHDVGPHYDDRHKNIVHEMKLGSLSSIVRIIPYWEKFYFSTSEEAEQALKGGAE